MNVLKNLYRKKERSRSFKSKSSVDFFTKNHKINKNNFLSFLRREDKEKYNLIAEIKRKSPSAGLIREKFNHVEIALNYKSWSKMFISIDRKNYFGGKN